MYDAMLAESVTITGHNGDEIEAYSARTLQAGPVGGVVVIHHLPGYDRQTKEFTRTFAAGGLNAVMPNLYHREAPGAAPDDAMATARASGAIPLPDERIVGEVAGAAAYLRGLSNSNGKVGVIGHCSGGRQAFLAANGRRRLLRRRNRDRVQPALPDGRPRRGPDRGHWRFARRGQAPELREVPEFREAVVHPR